MIGTETTSLLQNNSDNPSASAILWIGRSTAVLVALLAVAGFALSFEALRDLAVTTGAIPNPRQAWLFPVLLDGGMVVFSLAALRASLSGCDRRWYMTLVIIVTLLSVGFNIAHSSRNLLSGVMAGMPPLLLFMAFESLMRQIQDSLKIPGKKPGKRPSVTPKAVASAPLQTEDRRIRATLMWAEGMSKRKIAKELGISPATVSRYVRNMVDAPNPSPMA